MIFGWSPACFLHPPTTSGALRTEGGWGGFAMDDMGLLCFGNHWPAVGWIMALVFAIGLLALLV